MRRRTYLATALAGIGTLAGCLSDQPGPAGGSDANGSDLGSADATGQPPVGEVQLPLDESQLSRGAAKDAIPAITDPAYGPDWSTGQTSESLRDGDRVIGVKRDGEARAYPLRILNFHEIVNDEFAGPLLVTFCPLCGSGVTAERCVEGAVTTFGVSGLLWRSDLVMYDERTESLWSQILGKAIRGPQTGTSLSLVPSQILTWSEWQRAHPDTAVLLPPPDSGTITGRHPTSYTRNPYAGYDETSRIGIGANDFEDDRLHPKTEVIGVTADGESRAYPLPAVEAAGVVNDRVGDRPVVIAALPGGTLVAYDRQVEGATVEFSRADERHLAADGSTWELATGRAIDGPHESARLEQANDRSPMFWFAWADFHPETGIYQG